MAEAITTDCCISGGGPAGMMLGYLLARAGIDVVVIEKHADFLRDFRGDTIHPSTLEVMYELGLIDEFLKLPHQKAYKLSGQIGEARITPAEFSHLPVHCPYIAFMPQWDFLDFLAKHGRQFSTFRLMMRTEAKDLLMDGGTVRGLRAETADGPIEIRAKLVVGCDGRHSTVREKAGLQVQDIGAPMDVLWFALPREATDPDETMGRFDPGVVFIMINRGDHWQCGFVIAKGSIEAVHRAGLPAFRTRIAELAPFLGERVQSVASFDEVKLLTVGVDRLTTWHKEGLICIGDAAHTMSPVGGVGVNLAIQDAVATANILFAPLKAGRVTEADLAAVQKRREWPARATQAVQVFIQKRVIARVLGAGGLGPTGAAKASQIPVRPPLLARLFNRFPILSRLPGRMIGMGVRPEHVRLPTG
ncbi:2-polyprenyl-6-methoxyphenol hydroxylase [Rhizobiales bacterium GAS113]|nr:2-polyprenyl-6-methoxyphenol hydroxylase [Rhizobiales bacterium GAS113]